MLPARVAELVDAHVSGACSERSAGSSPVPGTKEILQVTQYERKCKIFFLLYPSFGQMKTFLDRLNPLYGHLHSKEVIYMVTAMDESRAQLDRAIDALQGFVDCFDDMHVRARIYGDGAEKKGEIQNTPAFMAAYKAGKEL